MYLKDCKSLETLEWKKCNPCTDKIGAKMYFKDCKYLETLEWKKLSHVPSKLESKCILRIVNLLNI